MVAWSLDKGREALIDGTIDVDTNAMKMGILDPVVAGVGIKAITAASNATPIVITSAAHGFANGDVVVILNVGGNTAANNIWKVKNQAANTFELASVKDGTTNSVGNAAYTSGGFAINLSPSASGDNLDDYDGAILNTSQTLTTVTVLNGKFSCATVTFPSVAGGNTIRFLLVWKDTGTPSTSRVLTYHDGTHLVTCNTTTTGTAIPVEPLQQAIANSSVLIFSNGVTVTLTGAAAAGDRSITISSATVTAGAYASAPVTGSNIPLVTNGGSVTVTIDATNGILRLSQ